jgi:putative transposase
MARRDRLEIFMHCVWATWDRLPLITSAIERRLHRNIENEALDLGCKVLALNGIEDHVHLFVKIPSTLCVATLMKQVKGVSSHFVNAELQPDSLFKWQGTYGAFSVCRWEVDKITRYIERQKEHHRDRTFLPANEETCEFVMVEDQIVVR